MTQATDVDFVPARSNDGRVIAVIGAVHFVSHYYILLLPPLFVFVKAEYGVSYTELGFALAAFNVISAVLQTPAGFLVDRISARLVLMAGLLLGAGAFAVAGLVDSFWVLVVMFAVAGLGNTVYHPADYALLSHHVSPERIGQAFSIHTFSGMLGSAVAPASLLLMQSIWGWRGAFLGAAVLGFAVAALLASQRQTLAERPSPTAPRADAAKPASAQAEGWKLLLSAPIVRNLIFFVLLAVMSGGLQNYSVVALNASYGTPIGIGNTALTAFLLLNALGVLAGGLIVARTSRHALVATGGLIATAIAAVLVGLVDLGSALLIVVMSLGGFLNGLMMPSRDMIVREVTPPGSFGKVFGFVTTGFNIGGIVSPLLFGALMDHGDPRAIFLTVAVCCLISIPTVMTRSRRAADV
jgi:MFS transporter, FSR family, fosmidomycin resistance protein